MTTDNQPIQYSHLEDAHATMDLSTQERALYERHLDNLWGKGGVDNPDGSRSSIYSLGIEHEGKQYEIPSVYDGKVLQPGEAIDRAHAQGIDTFPSYGSPEEADARYSQLHSFMEKDTQVYQDVMRRAATPYTELRPLQKKGLQSIQNQNTHEDPNAGKPLSDTDLNMLNQMSPEDFNALRTRTKGAINDHPILQTWPHRLVDAIIHSGVTALKGTYGIATGQIDPSSPEAIQSVTEGAGLVIGGAGGVSSAIGTDATHGAFLSYGKAIGLNKDNMLKAIGMKEAGATEEQIFKVTGAEYYEGKWGTRVPYSGMELKLKPTKVDAYELDAADEFVHVGKVGHYEIQGTKPLHEVMDHPELFKADPSLKNIQVRSMTADEMSTAPNVHGFTDMDATFIAIHPGLTEDQFKRALVHETEHVVQSRHGFPGGSASEVFQDASYRSLQNNFNHQSAKIYDKLYDIDLKGQKLTLPTVTHSDDIVPTMASIAIKGKYTPNRLTAEEKAVYLDILKYNLTKDLESIRWTQNSLKRKDWENDAKYQATKGEVGSRVAEQELDLTKDEIKDTSWKRFMEAMVPEKKRINSPLDPGGTQQSVVPPKDFPKDLKGSNENTSPRIANTSLWDRLANQQKGKDVWSGIKESLGNLRTSLSEKIFGKSELRPSRPANENVKFDAQTMGNSDRAYLDGIDQLLKMSNKEFFEKMHDPKTLEMLKKNPVGEKKLNAFISEIEKLQKPTLSKYEEAVQRQKDKPKPK